MRVASYNNVILNDAIAGAARVVSVQLVPAPKLAAIWLFDLVAHSHIAACKCGMMEFITSHFCSPFAFLIVAAVELAKLHQELFNLFLAFLVRPGIVPADSCGGRLVLLYALRTLARHPPVTCAKRHAIHTINVKIPAVNSAGIRARLVVG